MKKFEFCDSYPVADILSSIDRSKYTVSISGNRYQVKEKPVRNKGLVIRRTFEPNLPPTDPTPPAAA